MRIRGKILVGLAVVVFVTMAMGGYAVVGLRKAASLAERLYDGPLMASDFASSASANFARLDLAFGRALARLQAGEKADARDVKRFEEAILDDLSIVEERAPEPENVERVETVREAVARWSKLREQVFAGAPDEALVKAMAGLTRELGGKLEILNEAAKEQGYNFRQEAGRIVESFVIALSAAVLFAVLVAAFIGFALARNIGSPIGAMTAAMGALAAGNNDVEIPGQGRTDEVGDMADAVTHFRRNAIENERLRADTARMAQESEERRRRRMAEMAETVRETSAAVDSIATATGSVDGAAQGMARRAGEVLAESQAVAAASEEALVNVQTVSSAAEELSASIREISGQVARASAVTRQAVASGENAQATIRSLSDVVTRISEVSKLIGEIAGHTNLLALNATIEAARAGEAGKGFAVVASEVKNLASQTGRSTEDINRLVGEILGAMKAAVAAVGEIGERIREVDGVAATIAAAMEQQGAATQEIARNVAQTAEASREVSTKIQFVAREINEVTTGSTQMRASIATVAQDIAGLRRIADRLMTTAGGGAERDADAA
jgi:methyl-accepting chemotaxis protein